MENTGFSFLRLRIDDCHHSVQRLGSEWSYIFRELSDLLDNSEIRYFSVCIVHLFYFADCEPILSPQC